MSVYNCRFQSSGLSSSTVVNIKQKSSSSVSVLVAYLHSLIYNKPRSIVAWPLAVSHAPGRPSALRKPRSPPVHPSVCPKPRPWPNKQTEAVTIRLLDVDYVKEVICLPKESTAAASTTNTAYTTAILQDSLC